MLVGADLTDGLLKEGLQKDTWIQSQQTGASKLEVKSASDVSCLMRVELDLELDLGPKGVLKTNNFNDIDEL